MIKNGLHERRGLQDDIEGIPLLESMMLKMRKKN